MWHSEVTALREPDQIELEATLSKRDVRFLLQMDRGGNTESEDKKQ